MPELPEVEAARRLCARTLVGRTVTDVDAVDDESACVDCGAGGRRRGRGRGRGHGAGVARRLPSLLLVEVFPGATPASLAAALTGRTLTATGRKGKNMWLRFGAAGDKKGTAASTPPSLDLALHFGMTGSVAVRGEGRVAYVNTDTGEGGRGEGERGESRARAGPPPSSSPPQARPTTGPPALPSSRSR